MRYHKRSFVINQKAKVDPGYVKSNAFKSFVEHPYQTLVNDLAFFAKYSKKKFSNAKIYLLGHSEGTSVSLRAAQQLDFVSGVALIGFYNESLQTTSFEQRIYRDHIYFAEADANKDGVIDQKELELPKALQLNLKSQMGLVDLNRDGKLSESEYRAAQYLSFLASGTYIQSYNKDEVAYMRPVDIIASTKFKVLFLQGEWDNQTPAYFTRTMEMLNNVQLKRPDMKFKYFDKAGYMLDDRSSYYELAYHKLTPTRLEEISSIIGDFFTK